MSNAESYLTGTGIVLLAIYFLPAIVAAVRKHRQTMAIVVLDLLVGWTLLGWIAALVWACTADTKRTAPHSRVTQFAAVAVVIFGALLATGVVRLSDFQAAPAQSHVSSNVTTEPAKYSPEWWAAQPKLETFSQAPLCQKCF